MSIEEALERLRAIASSESTTEGSMASGLNLKAVAVVLLDIREQLSSGYMD